MKTRRAWAWLAAGVLALGLNGFYQDGGAAWAHRAMDGLTVRVAERSLTLLSLASEALDRVREKANLIAPELVGASDETASCRLSTAVVRFQTGIARMQNGMARFEAMSAREEGPLARMEAHRARMDAQVEHVRLAPVAFNTVEIPAVTCPRVRVNVLRINAPCVSVPQLLMVPAPGVQVEMLGDGPI